MAFEAFITRRALLDIDESTIFIALDSASKALKWKNSLEVFLHSLRENPKRFPLIRSEQGLKHNYRSALYGSHSIIFRIDEAKSKIVILRVYHLARKPLTKKELD